jgi:hypothetical protein
MDAHGYGNSHAHGNLPPLSLCRFPDAQVVPTTTYKLDHSTVSSRFVAWMLQLNHCRSGSYNAEREAHAKLREDAPLLTQGSADPTQGSGLCDSFFAARDGKRMRGLRMFLLRVF